MRSALELDAEVRRLRRSIRRLVGFLTLALVLGVAVTVAVVSASLTDADKEAFRAFNGNARKADAARADVAKAKDKAAKAETVKDTRQPPARETVGLAPAPPQQPAQPPAGAALAPARPAPAATAASPEPPPAPAREAATAAQALPAAPPAPATAAPAHPAPAPQATSLGVASTPPPAVPDQRRTAEPRKRHQRQVARTRPTEDTEGDANSVANPADRPREETDGGARSRHRHYGRVRTADHERDHERMRSPDDESDRVTVITKRRPPAYGPPFEEPYDRAPEVHRDRGWDGPFGLFGGLFGGRSGRGDE